MTTPAVSVVIDNYNYGRFLPEAIDSVLAQDFPAADIEIIVVDDGSTDDSREVLKRYAGKVQAVLQANQGYAAAFNAGIAKARGAVVCLLDADDVWKPHKLARVMKAFGAEPRLSSVQHLLQDADAKLSPLPQQMPSWPPAYALEDYLEGRAALAATSGLAFRREALQAALPIPVELRFLYADEYLSVRALMQGPCANISELLAFHRVHGDNYCAGAYGKAERLAADFTMRRVFHDRVEPLLRAQGKALSPQYRRLEELELARREVLYHAHEGRRGAAFSAWLKALGRHGGSRFGLFRLATCGLAVASPSFYLSLYEHYARGEAIKSLRRRWLPV